MKMFFDYIFDYVDNMIDVVRKTRQSYNAYHELNRLTDRELADLGLSRGDITRVAFRLDERVFG